MADPMLSFKLEYTAPVDLLSLTTSLSALGKAFEVFAAEKATRPLPGNIRLHVREMRQGSIIADLIPLASQVDWLLDQRQVLAGFVTHLNDIAAHFLGRSAPVKDAALPSPVQAQRLSQMVEPVVKDQGAQINLTVNDNGHVTVNQFHIGYVEANAIQNGVKRQEEPSLPSETVRHDQLMKIRQVRNLAKPSSADLGVIAGIWPNAVRLRFSSEKAKNDVLALEGVNPLTCTFLVDVKILSEDGKPKIYQILEVKEIIPPEEGEDV